MKRGCRVPKGISGKGLGRRTLFVQNKPNIGVLGLGTRVGGGTKPNEANLAGFGQPQEGRNPEDSIDWSVGNKANWGGRQCGSRTWGCGLKTRRGLDGAGGGA